jgi:hypothetical protein
MYLPEFIKNRIPEIVNWLPRSAHEQIKERVFERQVVVRSKVDSPNVFCIVHWNAPDFLLLNISQIESLYPDSKVYLLDNGSQQVNIDAIKKGVEKFDNVTLFVTRVSRLAEKIGIDHVFDLYGHVNGLQFLLNYSAQQLDQVAVFLDQDCILSNDIDGLSTKLSQDIILIGARDYVIIPRDYGPLKKGIFRNCYNLVHPSFMILQPTQINHLFGDLSLHDKRTTDTSLYNEKATREPYHGLSFKSSGRILFLEPRMHNEIPLLTSYVYENNTYAWHAWYSSRAIGFPPQSSLDGLPVSWLQEVRKKTYEYLKQVHKDTVAHVSWNR